MVFERETGCLGRLLITFVIAKKNVNLLLNTTNTTKMEKIAEVLGVKFTDLFVYDGEQEELNGFVEYKGEVYRIKTKADLENLLLSIK